MFMDAKEADQRTIRHLVQRWNRGASTAVFWDNLVREFPATIYLNGQELVTLLCTPEYLEDLGIGFLMSEGMLRNRAELETVTADYEKGQIWVKSSAADSIAEKTYMKRYLTTGCGKGTTFYNLDGCTPLNAVFQLTPEQIMDRMKDLQNRSELFQTTGGVHSAALASAQELILYREDIGRHNAVDKILGYCFRQGLDLGKMLLVTSGRLSSEMLLKTAKAGISVLVSRSAPTGLAVELAKQLRVTIVGFAREPRFNIYGHAERIDLS